MHCQFKYSRMVKKTKLKTPPLLTCTSLSFTPSFLCLPCPQHQGMENAGLWSAHNTPLSSHFPPFPLWSLSHVIQLFKVSICYSLQEQTAPVWPPFLTENLLLHGLLSTGPLFLTGAYSCVCGLSIGCSFFQAISIHSVVGSSTA